MFPINNPRTRYGLSRNGFSLIELLVAITVLAILATLIVGVSRSAYMSSQKAVAMNGLRSIGGAIQLYAQDNQGYLPGPLWSSANAFYGRTDERALGYHLAPYLGLPQTDSGPQVFPQASCPLFEDVRPADGTPAYFITQSVTLPEGNRNPWGYRSKSQSEDEGSRPQLLSRIIMESDPDTWAMHAADAGNITNPSAGWASKILPEPLFGDVRLYLYFDWHVEFVPVE